MYPPSYYCWPIVPSICPEKRDGLVFDSFVASMKSFSSFDFDREYQVSTFMTKETHRGGYNLRHVCIKLLTFVE